MARLFFALWPSEDAAVRLARLAQDLGPTLGGRPMSRDKIHLTLVFLGDHPPGREAAAAVAAEGIRGHAFSTALDALGAFRGARVAWITDSRPHPGLLALQSDLESALRDAGWMLEERPFRPHVTLVRGAERTQAMPQVDPIRWRVTDFALVRSEPNGRYATLRSWPLDA